MSMVEKLNIIKDSKSHNYKFARYNFTVTLLNRLIVLN